jgi:hypothetical protein
MLAVTGYVIQAFFRLPGAIDLDGTTFQSIPNGVAAVGAISSFGWLQIVASIGNFKKYYFTVACSININYLFIRLLGAHWMGRQERRGTWRFQLRNHLPLEWKIYRRTTRSED